MITDSSVQMNDMNHTRRNVKTRQAAIESGMSESWLYHNWKRIPAARRAGRALRWDVDELLDWMRKQAQEQ